MEEDLKKIEYFLDLLDETIDENIEVEEIEIKELRQAIENLIKGYRNLDKENTRQHELLGKIHEKYQKDYIPNERLIHYMDVALENSKQCLKKGNKIRANEEYKRYKDLKDIVDDLVYHKTLAKGDK